jgi:hypothetical protein
MFWAGVGLAGFGTVQLFIALGTFLLWKKRANRENEQQDQPQQPQQPQVADREPPTAYEELGPRINRWKDFFSHLCPCGCREQGDHNHDQR